MRHLISLLGMGLVAAMLALSSPHIAAAADGPGRRVALVVGIGRYQYVPRLDNPASDARLVASTLADLGFTLFGGGAQLDLDKPAFDKAVQAFGRQLAGGADVALFYYAGHGLQIGGTNWLVPTSANPTREADADFELVSADLVLRQMEGAGTRLNLVLLDACRNNPFSGRGLRAAGGGLAQMSAPDGTLISYATQPGNVAQDGLGHSPYTKALADALRQPGLNVFRLFNEVGLQVKRATGGDQQPWLSNSPIDGEFYFVPPRPAAPPQPSPLAADLQLWDQVKTSRDPQTLQRYVDQFPNGAFVPLARAEIASLTRKPEPPPAPSPQAADAAYWDSIKSSADPKALQSYVDRFPNGAFVAVARTRIAALTRPAAPPPGPSPQELDLAAWEQIKTSNDPAAFRAYLEKFPAGNFAGLARARIAALTAPPPTPMPQADAPGHEFDGRYTAEGGGLTEHGRWPGWLDVLGTRFSGVIQGDYRIGMCRFQGTIANDGRIEQFEGCPQSSIKMAGTFIADRATGRHVAQTEMAGDGKRASVTWKGPAVANVSQPPTPSPPAAPPQEAARPGHQFDGQYTTSLRSPRLPGQTVGVTIDIVGTRIAGTAQTSRGTVCPVQGSIAVGPDAMISLAGPCGGATLKGEFAPDPATGQVVGKTTLFDGAKATDETAVWHPVGGGPRPEAAPGSPKQPSAAPGHEFDGHYVADRGQVTGLQGELDILGEHVAGFAQVQLGGLFSLCHFQATIDRLGIVQGFAASDCGSVSIILLFGRFAAGGDPGSMVMKITGRTERTTWRKPQAEPTAQR